MISISSIYSNPVLPEGIYVAKVIGVENETFPTPAVYVKLRLGPDQKEASGKTMVAVVYDTEKGRPLLSKFRQTFRTFGKSDSAAVGKWGCIGVFKNSYQGTKFGNVNFIDQKPLMRQKEAKYRMLDQHDSLDWELGGHAKTSKPKTNDSDKRNMTGHEDWVDLDDITFER